MSESAAALPSTSFRPAIALALAANFIFAVMNVAMKWMGGHGISISQITFTHGAIGFAALSAWFFLRAGFGALRVPAGKMAAYTVISVAACFCIFSAFTSGQIALVSTIVNTSTIAVAAMAALFLRERLSRAQVALVLCGFAGILMVFKPRPAIDDYLPLILATVGMLFYAASQILVRRMSGDVRPLAFMYFYYIGLVVVSAFFVDFTKVLSPPPALLASASCDIAGLALLYSAYRCAPASLVAPFSYSNILWTTLFGILFWSEVPDAWAMTGMAAVIVSGVFFTRLMLSGREA